ncbi:hypothetical protein QP339_09600, partial [Aerococcus sp. UMB7834]|nr:hypothetical protein [Aerococcus sp. UMB7834]
DGMITPAEVEELNRLNEEAKAKKATAQEAVSAIPDTPEGAKTAKDGFQGRLDKLDGIQVPSANDENSNGIPDDVDTKITDAEAKVAAAEAADQAAKAKLAEANQDGMITPAEVEELNRLNEEAKAKKATAQEAVSAIPDTPEGAKTAKDGFQGRLNKLTGIEVPQADDANNDGVKDTDAAEVDALVKVAEQAYEDLAKALKSVGNVVTPTVHQDLAAKLADAKAKKATAQVAVDRLPDSVGKTGFQTRLDSLKDPSLPTIAENGAGNIQPSLPEFDMGLASKLAKADDLVNAAEKAYKDLADAIEAAGPTVKPEVHEALVKQVQAAEKAKADAQAAVDELPVDVVISKTYKDQYQGRLDKLVTPKLPEVAVNG